MNDLKPFKHGEEGTHGCCQEVLEKMGNQATCCECNGHKCKIKKEKQTGKTNYVTGKNCCCETPEHECNLCHYYDVPSPSLNNSVDEALKKTWCTKHQLNHSQKYKSCYGNYKQPKKLTQADIEYAYKHRKRVTPKQDWVSELNEIILTQVAEGLEPVILAIELELFIRNLLEQTEEKFDKLDMEEMMRIGVERGKHDHEILIDTLLTTKNAEIKEQEVNYEALLSVKRLRIREQVLKELEGLLKEAVIVWDDDWSLKTLMKKLRENK